MSQVMDISGIGSAQSFAGLTNTPAVQRLEAEAQTDSSLFSGATGNPSDLEGFTPTAAAFALYQNPALLNQLQGWDGSQLPGSQRTSDATDPSTAGSNGVEPKSPFTFNPFDQSSWDTSWKGTSVDTTA